MADYQCSAGIARVFIQIAADRFGNAADVLKRKIFRYDCPPAGRPESYGHELISRNGINAAAPGDPFCVIRFSGKELKTTRFPLEWRKSNTFLNAV